MTGLQTTSVKQQLGTMLNGTFTFDFWLPAPALQFPGVMAFLKRYQAQAASAGVDPLGYYLAPWAYARMQILGEAIAMTQSLDQDKLAEYIRSHTFDTFVGEVAFGEKGEWTKARVLAVQFQNVKSGELSEFIDGKGEVVLWPPEFKAGEVMAPYSEIPH
jgi:branched-chain amino acid transport system substrate-binding protein